MSRSESSKLLKSRWLGRKEVRDKVKEEERFVKSMDSLVELARHSITSNLNGSKNFEEYVENQIKKEWNTTNFDKIKNMWGSEKLGVRISLFVDNEFTHADIVPDIDWNIAESVRILPGLVGGITTFQSLPIKNDSSKSLRL